MSRAVPIGVKLIAALNVVGAVAALPIVGRTLVLDHPLALLIGSVGLMLVGAEVLCTYGLLTLRYWGWAGRIALHVISAVLDTFNANAPGLVSSVVIVLYLLLRADVFGTGQS